MTSSWEAMRLGDLLLGERLAQSALDRSGGLTARLPLAHALSWLGRGPDADKVLTPVDPNSLSEWDLTAWTLPKAANQFWMLDQPEAAVDFLYAMRDRISEPAAVATIDALVATFAMNSGDPRRAVETAAEVLGFTCQPGPCGRLGGGDRDLVERPTGQVRRRRSAGRTRHGGGTSGAAAVHHRPR